MSEKPTSSSNTVTKTPSNSYTTPNSSNIRVTRLAAKQPPTSSSSEVIAKLTKKIDKNSLLLDNNTKKLDEILVIITGMATSIEELKSSQEEALTKVKDDTTTCKTLQKESHLRQKARDVFFNFKRNKRRGFENHSHHYKHYVINRNKAKLFENFLENSNGGKCFIPRKYREKVSTIQNTEVLEIKKKESIQKMRNDIECMTEYANTHQAKVLEIESNINNSAYDSEFDPDLVSQVLALIQSQFDEHKQKSAHEWESKERFFLKLQQEFMEKVPAIQTSSKEEDESLVNQLVHLADNTQAVPPEIKNNEAEPATTGKPKEPNAHSKRKAAKKPSPKANRDQRNSSPPHTQQTNDARSTSTYRRDRKRTYPSPRRSPRRSSYNRERSKSPLYRRNTSPRQHFSNRSLPNRGPRTDTRNYWKNSYYDEQMGQSFENMRPPLRTHEMRSHADIPTTPAENHFLKNLLFASLLK